MMLNKDILYQLYEVIISKKMVQEENSYTYYLFEQGLDKILKKCGEECSEVIIAAKNDSKSELISELSDLMYHIVVLMVEKDIKIEDVLMELEARSQKIGNLKKIKLTDRMT